MSLPPIEGLPAVRPRCAHCDQMLRPWIKQTRGKVGKVPSVITRREFDGWWRGYPRRRPEDKPPTFCRLRCALAFAEAAHKAGYRMTRKEKP